MSNITGQPVTGISGISVGIRLLRSLSAAVNVYDPLISYKQLKTIHFGGGGGGWGGGGTSCPTKMGTALNPFTQSSVHMHGMV